MRPQEKITITIHAALTIRSIADIIHPISKTHCRLVVTNAEKTLAALKAAVEALPED